MYEFILGILIGALSNRAFLLLKKTKSVETQADDVVIQTSSTPIPVPLRQRKL